ncbi:hypothetical protein [Nesterenkonia pannonica]|uniref:hypothetical protein n=1 Tax=Nesterenkonia pannonica TaxID=1548602 RepID=UPI002164BB34|nr:hypothetical protein [Nesterenkonia pannonica]
MGLTVALGLAMASLWEMVEWVGFEYVTQDIYVTYADTIGDMAAGGLGSLFAGYVVLRCRLTRIER